MYLTAYVVILRSSFIVLFGAEYKLRNSKLYSFLQSPFKLLRTVYFMETRGTIQRGADYYGRDFTCSRIKLSGECLDLVRWRHMETRINAR
jgi:hypothetical protein